MQVILQQPWIVNGLYLISALTLLGAIPAIALRRVIGKLPSEGLLAGSLLLGFAGAVKNAAADRMAVPDALIVIVAIAAGIMLLVFVGRGFRSNVFQSYTSS